MTWLVATQYAIRIKGGKGLSIQPDKTLSIHPDKALIDHQRNEDRLKILRILTYSPRRRIKWPDGQWAEHPVIR